MLAGYYRRIGQVATRKVYRVADLRPLLACCSRRAKVREYGDAPEASESHASNVKRWVKAYFDETNRIERANRHLHERKLVILERHQHEPDVVLITLTVEGYDLGGKYAGFFTRSGLWFDEYRKHWLWLLVAFFGGAIGMKVLDFIVGWVTSRKNP